MIYTSVNIYLFFKIDKPTFRNFMRILLFGPWLYYLKGKTNRRVKNDILS